MSEPVSFRLNEDFKVKLGKDQTEITIPRLLYKDAQSLLDIVARYVAQSSFTTLQIATSLSNLENLSESLVNKTFSMLIQNIGYKVLNELLELLSYKSIPQEIIETMSYDEAAKLVQFLFEKNFESLKNCFASLEAMTMLRSTEESR